MQTIVTLLALVAVASAGVAYAPATYLTRAPAFDSAVIKSDRLGGNFAYSVAESHAYAAHTPIVQHVTSPVAVSYSAPAVTYAHHQPAYTYAAAPRVAAVAAPHYGYAAGPIAYNGAYGYAAPAFGYNSIIHK